MRIGGTLHVFLGATKEELNGLGVDRKIARALRRGQCVEEDQVKRFERLAPTILTGRVGSSAFVWNGDCERVKATRTLVTVYQDGFRTENVIGEEWVRWENV